MPFTLLRTPIDRLREHVRVPLCTGDRDGHRHDVADPETEPEIRGRLRRRRRGTRHLIWVEGATERDERTGRPEEHHDDQPDRSYPPEAGPPALACTEAFDEVAVAGGPRRCLPHPGPELVIDARHGCSPHRCPQRARASPPDAREP